MSFLELPPKLVKTIFNNLNKNEQIKVLNDLLIKKNNSYECSELTLELLQNVNFTDILFEDFKKDDKIKYWINFCDCEIIINNQNEYNDFLKIKKEYNLKYIWEFDTDYVDVPYGVTHLIFGYKEKYPLGFFDKIDSLSYEEFFNEKLKEGHSERFLSKVMYKYFYSEIKKVNLPNTIKRISFKESFNQPIEKGFLPDSLTHLTFGNKFNQPIKKGFLPKSLTHLSFGYNFNQPFEKDVLPYSLTHLTFGVYFNQPLNEGVLPDSLTHLIFGYYFNT